MEAVHEAVAAGTSERHPRWRGLVAAQHLGQQVRHRRRGRRRSRGRGGGRDEGGGRSAGCATSGILGGRRRRRGGAAERGLYGRKNRRELLRRQPPKLVHLTAFLHNLLLVASSGSVPPAPPHGTRGPLGLLSLLTALLVGCAIRTLLVLLLAALAGARPREAGREVLGDGLPRAVVHVEGHGEALLGAAAFGAGGGVLAAGHVEGHGGGLHVMAETEVIGLAVPAGVFRVLSEAAGGHRRRRLLVNLGRALLRALILVPVAVFGIRCASSLRHRGGLLANLGPTLLRALVLVPVAFFGIRRASSLRHRDGLLRVWLVPLARLQRLLGRGHGCGSAGGRRCRRHGRRGRRQRRGRHLRHARRSRLGGALRGQIAAPALEFGQGSATPGLQPRRGGQVTGQLRQSVKLPGTHST
mmetsp:Transcript_12430/g.43867  ORF Transcript_12430/g.43867 Transcript_12430/m.43867 type:complete len:413 (-) Transcript_12430:1608-2846(-)